MMPYIDIDDEIFLVTKYDDERILLHHIACNYVKRRMKEIGFL
jgi:hypothetical protein